MHCAVHLCDCEHTEYSMHTKEHQSCHSRCQLCGGLAWMSATSHSVKYQTCVAAVGNWIMMKTYAAGAGNLMITQYAVVKECVLYLPRGCHYDRQRLFLSLFCAVICSACDSN